MAEGSAAPAATESAPTPESGEAQEAKEGTPEMDGECQLVKADVSSI